MTREGEGRKQAGFDQSQPDFVSNCDGRERARLGYNFIIPIYVLQIKTKLWPTSMGHLV